MKHLALFLAFSLFGISAIADTYQLRCEFLPTSGLQGFTAEINEDTAYLKFDGEAKLNSLLDPAGERVTLQRRRPFVANWMLYSGTVSYPHLAASGCFIFENGNCIYPSRGFDLSISPGALLRKGERSGNLSFTQISEYLPGAAFYGHDIFCAEVH